MIAIFDVEVRQTSPDQRQTQPEKPCLMILNDSILKIILKNSYRFFFMIQQQGYKVN